MTLHHPFLSLPCKSERQGRRLHIASNLWNNSSMSWPGVQPVTSCSQAVTYSQTTGQAEPCVNKISSTIMFLCHYYHMQIHTKILNPCIYEKNKKWNNTVLIFTPTCTCCMHSQLDCVKRIWYLSPMRAAKVRRACAVSPEPQLLAHTSCESRGTFRQKARSLAPLNGWACAVKICHDGMLEDTNSLDGTQLILSLVNMQ